MIGLAYCSDCEARECRNGDSCRWYKKGACNFCHCDSDDDDAYIEVKCWSNKIYPSDAHDLVSQGVEGVLCGGEISENAKKILDDAEIWYEENVEPHELERAVEEGEAEW